MHAFSDNLESVYANHKKAKKIRIEKLDKRKKVPEYTEPSLVFVCDQENTTAHAYEELGEISPYYQNDKLP